jgi:branched-chain amino acid transport system substrate-binding protein
MRLFRTLSAALCAAFLLALLPLAPARSAEPPLEIDVILPLTGPGSFLGQTQGKTIKALETTINKRGGVRGRPVHFQVYDDATNPQNTVQLANQILAKKVPFVMGASLSATCRAMNPLFANGPVQYCLSPAIYPPNGSYVFSSSVSTKDLIFGMMRYAHDRGWTRIGRLTTTDASGQDGDTWFAEALKQPEFRGMTIVANEHYNPSDVNVAAQVARLKAANPQAIAIWAPGTPFGTALRGLKDAGVDLPTMSTNANMVNAQVEQYKNFLPTDLYMEGVGFLANRAETTQMRQSITLFDKAMHDAGITIDFQAGMAWDPGMILISALQKLGTNATPAQIRDYILGLKDYGGISGVYNFSDGNQHGLDINDLVMMRWDPKGSNFVPDGKFGAHY